MMDDSAKKRILGLLIIFIVLAVFLPLFLKGEGYRERQLESRIPPAPEMPEVVEVKPQLPKLEDTRKLPPVEVKTVEVKEPVVVAKVTAGNEKKTESAKQPIPESEKRPVVSVKDKKPQLDSQNVPVGWTLQLASFKDQTNAKALKKQLINAGHKVYTRQHADIYKVFVGPDIDRSRLEALKHRLKTDFSLDGIIIRFDTQ